jgi:hypothetical protein
MHPREWDQLAAAADVKAAVGEHLAFLCETAACAEVLQALSAQATAVTIGHGDGMTAPADMPVLRIHFPYLEDGECCDGASDPVALTAFPGFAAPSHADTPAGFHQIATRHNGFAIHADKPNNWDFSCVLTPLDHEGALQDVGGFAAAEVRAQGGLPAAARAPLLWDHSDWITVTPGRQQPEWHFVSHGNCEARRITTSLGPAAVVLRVLAASILGHSLEHFFALG